MHPSNRPHLARTALRAPEIENAGELLESIKISDGASGTIQK